MNLKEYFKDYFSKTEQEREDMLIVLFHEYIDYVKSNKLSHSQMIDTLSNLMKRSEMEEEYEVTEAIKNLLATINQITNEKE